jgi:type IV pilus assembly protein PilW
MMKKSYMEASRALPNGDALKTRAGFTLLELLIALLIGSIVIAVVGGLFLANSNTFRAVDDSSRLQENGRFALQTISRIVRQSGFVPADAVANPSFSSQNNSFPPAGLVGSAPAPLPRISGTQFVSGTDGTGPNASDTLTLAFSPSIGGEIVDCSGAPRVGALLPQNQKPSDRLPIINTFYLAPSLVAGAGNALWCSVSLDGGATVVAAAELIGGVDSFQVLYGLNSRVAVPGSPSTVEVAPDSYTSANNLTTGDAFNSVLTVQVALVLRGSERSTLEAPLTLPQRNLNLFGSAANGAPLYTGDPGAVYLIPSDDVRRTFKVLTSTINLRNRGAA